MLDVSIIIVTYNSEKYIEECLASIYEKTNSTSYEIIVCDNNSKDSTIEKLKSSTIYKHLEKNLRIIKNENNLGYSKAANIAAKITKGKYLFFLNPDTVLINNAIDILYTTACKNPEIPVLGGKLSSKKGDYIYSCGFLPNIFDIILLLSNNAKRIKTKKININTQQYVELISGADFFVKKDIYNSFAGFDESYYIYYEELDFCFKLKNAGYKILFTPEAKIAHYCLKSQENSYLTASYNFRYAYIYCIRNMQNINFIATKLIFLFLLFFIKDNHKNIEEFKKNIVFLLKNK